MVGRIRAFRFVASKVEDNRRRSSGRQTRVQPVLSLKRVELRDPRHDGDADGKSDE